MPFNAEAPPEALHVDITPTDLHYVRSNFALPEHDGTLEIGGAVANSITVTLDDLRALPPLERGRHPRMRRERPASDETAAHRRTVGGYAVSTARWTGARLHDLLAQAQPTADGVEVLFRGADHGPYHLSAILDDTDQQELTFERALPLDLAVDPAAEILIAYEMNRQPLLPDYGAPFRLLVPHWYAVASLKWLKRIDIITQPVTGEFQTGHYIYEWPDKPHERVSLMRVRARITDPAPGAVIPNVQPDIPLWNRLGYGNTAVEFIYIDVR
jgi:DMSO/TMAO reductase YedYZ molybdopterin-dependent catalytic subunit